MNRNVSTCGESAAAGRTIFGAAIRLVLVAACALAFAPMARGQSEGNANRGANNASRDSAAAAASYVPDLRPLLRMSSSEMKEVVERYADDRFALLRRFGIEYSPVRRAQLKEFSAAWQQRLETIDFDSLGPDGKIDYVLLKKRLGYEVELLAREEKVLAETAPLIPFAAAIIELQEARRRMETINSAAAATSLARLTEAVEKTRKAVEAGLRPEPARGADARAEAPKEVIKTTKETAYRASEVLNGLRRTLEQWFKYYDGYDPLFSWWAAAPYKKSDDALKAYVKLLRERVVGIREGEDEPIIGRPIGRDELLADLAYEMIPYTPKELVVIAEREFSWCETEIKKATREMGLGDDWKAALERVKTLHVEPGKQPDLIRDLALEAVAFVEKHDLVTVPPLARDIWRIEMMTPERQKESPFFLGGEVIQVSFPTDTMGHEDKLMSMRGNNIHFSRATVFHELIPGHHLQGFMAERYNPHRRVFSTPFWTEGMALYWEMLFWDLGFPQSPENKIGMLFWRMHRAARIIFSLGFHLGTMTPQQCIDFLVDRVGHERANAAAEVRRSFRGAYPPLYQIAYMIGGLQFRALHKELVESGRMTNREFHDAILMTNRIPVEMIRAALTKQPVTRDYKANWRFAGELPAKR